MSLQEAANEKSSHPACAREDASRGRPGGASGRQRAADQAMIDARVKIFGLENVDAATGAVKKDKVVFSWLGHISGAVSMLGRVVLLDSYIPRLEVTPGRTPFVIKDLVDIKPEAIFIGHGHSDHADNAVFIAAKTGATLYMTPEACGTAQTALARMKADTFMQADPFYAIAPATTVTCVPITTAGSTPGHPGRPHQPARAAGLHQRLPRPALGGGAGRSRLGSGPGRRHARPARPDAVPARRAADADQPAPARPAGPAPGQRARRRRPAELPLRRCAAATTSRSSSTTRSVR